MTLVVIIMGQIPTIRIKGFKWKWEDEEVEDWGGYDGED